MFECQYFHKVQLHKLSCLAASKLQNPNSTSSILTLFFCWFKKAGCTTIVIHLLGWQRHHPELDAGLSSLKTQGLQMYLSGESACLVLTAGSISSATAKSKTKLHQCKLSKAKKVSSFPFLRQSYRVQANLKLQ